MKMKKYAGFDDYVSNVVEPALSSRTTGQYFSSNH
jgi:hypothetical protein